MRLTSTDIIAGPPAPEVRELLRQVRREEALSLNFVASITSTPLPEAKQYIAALVDAGLLEPAEPVNGQDVWSTTVQGNAVAMAKFTKPVGRALAQRRLDEFLERVRDANAREEYLHWIDRVVLFGSLLDPTVDPVGDVDLVVTLSQRYPPDGNRDMVQRIQEFNEMHDAPRFSNIVEELWFPERRLIRYLKGQSTIFSIAQHDPIVEQVDHRVIYERLRNGVTEQVQSQRDSA
jgi:hypothetical protein